MSINQIYRPSLGQDLEKFQRRKKKGPRAPFEPTERQVLGMVNCLTAWLRKEFGTHYTDATYHVLAKEMLYHRRIYCKGSRYGRNIHQIRRTICVAFQRMEEEGKIRRETNSFGLPVIILREWEGQDRKPKY